MTTLIAWVGFDQRHTSSVYLASDSRISWGENDSWDTGRKLFASQTRPEVFGYCGDVTFPSQVLGQLIEQIDKGLLFTRDELFQHKLEIVSKYFKESFIGYPEDQKKKFSILYASRNHDGMASEFCLCKISWHPQDKWKTKTLNIPKYSALLVAEGSGAESLEEWYRKWRVSDSERTSRRVFSAFCGSLQYGTDSLSGGSPQLIGIYCIGAAQTFGIVYKGRRYMNGTDVSHVASFDGIEWRNKLFERCDGETMELLDGAQPQPCPGNLKI